jgi:hypothetical protein
VKIDDDDWLALPNRAASPEPGLARPQDDPLAALSSATLTMDSRSRSIVLIKPYGFSAC